MAELGRRFTQGREQAALGWQGLAQISTTHHVGDAETEFVDHGGELVCDEAIGSPQHHIATAVGIVIGNPQAPTGKPLLLPAPAVPSRPAEAGVDRLIGKCPPGAATGEQTSGAAQPRQPGVVKATPFALEQHRAIPLQAQPAQITLDRLDGTGAAARRIEVINAQQPGATGLTCRQP